MFVGFGSQNTNPNSDLRFFTTEKQHQDSGSQNDGRPPNDPAHERLHQGYWPWQGSSITEFLISGFFFI